MDADHAPRQTRRGILQGAAVAASALAATAIVAGPERAAHAQRVGRTFVLVAPAWHGGWCWNKAAPLLRAAGHEVLTPTLAGLGERAHLARPEIALATHVEDVAATLAYYDVSDAILIGHSSSGVVITGAAERVPERIAHLVFVDAFMPENGQALVDLIPPDRRKGMEAFAAAEGKGWLLPRFAPIPWEKIVRGIWQITDDADVRWMLARLVPTPFRTFTDAVERKNLAAAKLARTYIRCTKYEHAGFDRHAETVKRTPGWRLRTLDAPHHPAVTHPRELAALLLEAAA
jgi:pimeloyl-ACP methyl ester carboxylesterase